MKRQVLMLQQGLAEIGTAEKHVEVNVECMQRAGPFVCN